MNEEEAKDEDRCLRRRNCMIKDGMRSRRRKKGRRVKVKKERRKK